MTVTTPRDEKAAPGEPPPVLGPKASGALAAVLAGSEAEEISVGQLVAALHERAFGFILLLVALINCVPLPPGASTIAGIPVLLLGLQMLFGRHEPWLPGFIARRRFRRLDLIAGFRRIAPWLARIETVARPRRPRLLMALQPHLTGLVVVVLGLFIVTPMVFTNIPPAIASVVIAVALIEEDGLLLGTGLVVALGAMALSATLAAGAIAAVLYAGSRMFGI